jgi:Domain of unknown function (DUF4352)
MSQQLPPAGWPPSSGGPPPQPPRKSWPRRHGIGAKVRDGKFEFVVTRVTHAKSDGMGGTAQGEYTVLHLTVTNIGSESQTLDDSAQHAYDAAGHKYDASTQANIGLNQAGSAPFLESINPGNSVTGLVAFDMPVGDQAVKAELHDSIFSGGVTVSLR